MQGIETVEDMVGETDGWELDYTEMEDYPGKTPPALLLNSSYSPSFAAGLLQMRYIYSMGQGTFRLSCSASDR